MTDINKALKSKDPVVRHAAVKSEHFKPEHVMMALKDPDKNVRKAVVESPHFGPEHIEHALKDKELLVRVAAMDSPYYGIYLHHEKMKKEEDNDIKEKVKGGLADNKTLKDIAEKHKVDLSHIEEQFKMGQKVELEHTTNQDIADEIARDHLWEDSNYYTKLEEMEAKKAETVVVETTVDGHITRTPGKEPLKKEPEQSSVKKSLREVWDLLKAKVSANEAFISMEEPEEEEPAPEDQEEQPESQLSPEEEQQLQAHADEQEQDNPKMSQEEIIQAMKDEGYSDSEIAYVLHGHIPPIATADDHKAANEQMDGEQDRALAQREKDIKHDHMTKLNEIEQKKKAAELDSIDPEAEKAHAKSLKMLEYKKAEKQLEAEDHDGEKEHKRRMRDLEFQKAKAEMELELEYKKKELAAKLRMKEEAARSTNNSDSK
jgi:hypothetical protein